ncbi:MAG: Uma2 family endonuclease [Deltaproteobacteria bacterium]
MVAPAKLDATYEDVVAAPANMVAELLDGELFLQPRPAVPHASAASALGMIVGPPFHLGRGGPGGWIILHEPELHFGRDVLVPDRAGWRRADHAELDLDVAFFTAAPTWLCEVVSPSTRKFDRLRKLPRYHAAGVEHLWLVDPLEHAVEVYRRAEQGWLLAGAHADEETVEIAPFEGLEIHLSDLWVTERSDGGAVAPDEQVQ